MIKGSIQEEYITIVTINAAIIEENQCIIQMLTAIKGEINNNTIILKDLTSPLNHWTDLDRGLRRKYNL